MRKIGVILGLMIVLVACKEDPCESVTCLNGGTCIEGICECREGYEGATCETFALEQFLGTYDIEYEGCFETSPDHTVAIGQTAVGSAELEIINLGDYECPVNGPVSLSAEPDGNTITIPEQIIDCGSISYTFSGSGMIEADTISLSFSVTYESDGLSQQDNCTAKLIK